MNVWLVTITEPLPIDGEDRPLRAGFLAQRLLARGHRVEWWSSTFCHRRRIHRYRTDCEVRIEDGYSLRLIHGCGYSRSVSAARLLDHWLLAKKFAGMAIREPRPDVVVTSYPTPELCHACIRYGQVHKVPVVVDVRDLWPDALVRLLPHVLRPLAPILSFPMRRKAHAIFRGATAITGPTEGFVDWGLAQAGRAPGPWDRVFPFGYPDWVPTKQEREKAEKFWDAVGVPVRGSNAIVVCFFGTIGRQFDLATVIEAGRLLAQRRQPCYFVLCGDGDRLDYYRRLANGLKNIMLPGWVSPACLWVLMRRSTVGLAPYLNTSDFVLHLPNKPIEYLFGGLPILSCLRGHLRELITKWECGVIYEQGDAESLARAVMVLGRMDGCALRRMASNARKLYESTFVAERVYDEWALCLAGLVGASRGSRV